VASLPPRPWPSVLLIGPTGSGKSPLGAEIGSRGLAGRACLHFDFGACLRDVASGRPPRYGLAGEDLTAVRVSLATGALFEDRDLPLIVKILTGFAAKNGLGTETLLILNGLPRHRSQAVALSGTVAVELVVSLEADAAVIGERMRLDPGRDRAGRADDMPQAVDRRLAIFRERTAPLLDLYRDRGVPIARIAVTAAMTAADLLRELERKI
jgi:adenylate kinase family enzyme